MKRIGASGRHGASKQGEIRSFARGGDPAGQFQRLVGGAEHFLVGLKQVLSRDRVCQHIWLAIFGRRRLVAGH